MNLTPRLYQRKIDLMSKDASESNTDQSFPIGTRVRLVARTSFAGRTGTVINQGRTASRVRILWDGVKSPQTIATKYLERDDASRPGNDKAAN
jgi:hypothetical protein